MQSSRQLVKINCLMNLEEKFKKSVHKHVDRFYPISPNLVCQIIICQIPVEENISLEKGDLK